MTSSWRVLRARVPDALDDEIAAVLGGGSLGVEVARAGPGRSELRVYLGLADDAEAWLRRAERALSAHGVAPDSAGLVVEPVADGRWAQRWQEGLRPIPLGRRFVVIPSAACEPPPGRIPIRLVPGMAFGTGEHETTRMCAAAVERHVAAGACWLDLGTGTGVLALVAARSGAARVLALDLDPESAHVAAEVVAANDAAGRIEVRVGSIGDRGAERFDGIVANIQSSFFLAHADELAAALEDGGVAILSGFLTEDLEEIEEALSRAGLGAAERDADGPWACLTATRGAA